MVGVSLRYNRVTNVNEINANLFEGSKYGAETDKEKILSAAQNGGLFKNYSYPDAKETLDVELGTPEFGLVRIWKYEEEKHESKELFVPSLIFPITKMPDHPHFYQQNVIVPLVGDILDDMTGPEPRLLE